MLIEKSKLTTMQVCYLLNITPATLRNWYRYVNEIPEDERPKDCPGLPPYIQANPRAQKYWNGGDLYKLYAFQQWVPKGRGGKMGKTNSRYWSKKFYKKKN